MCREKKRKKRGEGVETFVRYNLTTSPEEREKEEGGGKAKTG